MVSEVMTQLSSSGELQNLLSGVVGQLTAGDGKGFEKLLSAAAQGDGAGGNMQELLSQARYRRDTAEIPPRYLPMHWLRLNDD